jgi:hypothetical protein
MKKMFGMIGAAANRPKILLATGTASDTDTNTRNLSVTPPAGTKLLVALLSYRMANEGSTFSVPTFNGVAMTVGSALISVQQRPSSAIYYMLNPPTGSAFTLNMDITGGNDWTSSFMRAFCLDRGTIGPNDNASSFSSGSSLSTGFTLAKKALVLALFSQVGSGTGNPVYSLTNLTLEHQAQDSGDTQSYAVAYNNDDPLGAQTYTFDSDWSAGTHYKTANALAIYP